MSFSSPSRNRTWSDSFGSCHAIRHNHGPCCQYPDLESNQDRNLRRIPCAPLHHRDKTFSKPGPTTGFAPASFRLQGGRLSVSSHVGINAPGQCYRERLCRRGSTEKGTRLVNGFMLVRIQSSALECEKCPDGVADSIGPSEGPGPGSIPGRDTDNMARGCAGSHDSFRSCRTRFDSWTGYLWYGLRV